MRNLPDDEENTFSEDHVEAWNDFANDDEDFADLSQTILESSHIIKSKIFKTEAEAKAWFNEQVDAHPDYVILTTEEDMFKLDDGRWDAVFEAENVVLEDAVIN